MKINLKSKKIRAAVFAVLLVIAVASAGILASHGRAVKDKPALFETDEKYACGIDVSSHNGEIDWQTVSENVDFAIIRAGYRGYGNGKLVADSRVEENLENALKAGMKIGVYFYSQAITEGEAREEADFVLELIKGYDIALPVFIDFEYAHGEDGELTGRLFESGITKTQASEIINAFCSRINENGKYAGVYSSSSMLNFDIASSKLNDNAYIWVADYNKTVTYLGSYDIWQYNKHGSCPGVNSKYVDVNYWFVK